MRIRTIKPEFYTHEELFEAEMAEKLPLRVAFSGLWCAADRCGRFKWEPRRLGILILPYDNIDFSRVLHALSTRGFIVRYRVGDAWFGAIPTWNKHQVINNRERPSEIPDLSQAEQVDASGTRGARVGHASKEEGKGREGKGKDLPPADKPQKAADSRHHEITSQWCERFRNAFGSDYTMSGQDLSALKRFLPTCKDSSHDILKNAEAAWVRIRNDRYAKACKAASSIRGLCGAYNDIRVELSANGNGSLDLLDAETFNRTRT